LWRQIQADIFGTELALVNVAEGAAFGAALLAGVGTGLFKDVNEAVQQTVQVVERTLPISENVGNYSARYVTYRALYPALKDIFRALGDTSL